MAYANRKQLINRFNALPEEIRNYLPDAEDLLVDEWDYEILIAYLFQKTETAHSMALYCGMIKRHRVHKNLAWRAVQSEYMTRDRFRELVSEVFEKNLPRKAVSTIKTADDVRDNIMHGKMTSEAQKRRAVGSVFQYAEQLNEFTYQSARFRPLASRGFAGTIQTLPKPPSRLVVKGLGLTS
ncbi:MAG: hypothetical protein ACYYKD_08780 [Rhodospirillales bacterium]